MLSNSEILDILARVKSEAEKLYDSENGPEFNSVVIVVLSAADILERLASK